MSFVTWTASSRVGTTTRACGRPSPGASIFCRIGTVQPLVLPVPERAWAVRAWAFGASGARRAAEVVGLERGRDGPLLDRERVDELVVRQGGDDVVAHAEIGER